MKVAIVGSRSYPDLDAVRRYVENLPLDTVVVSGGAHGVDRVATVHARSLGLMAEEHLPDYGRYGQAAPIIRNGAIVDGADRLVAFWDGQSRGTRNAIDRAQRRGIPVEVIRVPT